MRLSDIIRDRGPVVIVKELETMDTVAVETLQGEKLWESADGFFETSPFEDALNSSDWLPNLVTGGVDGLEPHLDLDVGIMPYGLVELAPGRWLLGRNPYYLDW